MGREWYFIWGSKSSNKKAGGIKGDRGGSGRGGGREKKSVRPQVTAATVASGGCMNALLHLFNFHHFHLCLHSQNSSYLPDDDDPTPSKGVEAPRNSLSNIEDEKQFYLNIPVDIQIKTNRRDTRLKLESKTKEILETIDSPAPGARTPTIVARLMGLDVLPESNTSTPRSSSSYSRVSTRSPPNRTTKAQRKRSVKNDLQSGLGRSSLPESPKSSTSSQRRMSLSTNVVDKHRLSLQINKENNIVKEMESSRRSCSAINAKKRVGRRYEDENNNNSPGFYAKQVMKQVKETVSSRRAFGADITNKIGQSEFRKDDNLLLEKQPIKPNKSRLIKSSESTKKTRISRCDVREIVPTIDKLEVKNNEQDYCYEKFGVDLKKFDNADNNGIKSCSKMSTKSCEYVRNKKDDELFVRPSTRGNNLGTEKKCKKTPLTKELVHSTVPSIVPLTKDSSYVQASPKKLLEKQGSSKAQITKLYNTSSTTTSSNNNNTVKQLSRKPGRRTNATIQQQEAAYNPVDHEKTTRTNKNSTTPTSTSIAEFQYISKILKCTGINYSDTSISLTKWFSPSHPLDPTIYHNLEASCYFTSVNIDHLPSDINRKLIFHLVDEILADMLLKPNNLQINGLELVKMLCRRIRSFTSIDCKTLQDIDALVEQDMPRFGEDSEAIVAEIERDIFDSLVQEIVVF